MNEFRGTPGRWRIEAYTGEHDEAGAVISAEIGKRIASTWGIWARAEAAVWTEYYANARLIAAAPELLKALLKLDTFLDFSRPMTDDVPQFEDPSEINLAMEEARAAIAKALGNE